MSPCIYDYTGESPLTILFQVWGTQTRSLVIWKTFAQQLLPKAANFCSQDWWMVFLELEAFACLQKCLFLSHLKIQRSNSQPQWDLELILVQICSATSALANLGVFCTRAHNSNWKIQDINFSVVFCLFKRTDIKSVRNSCNAEIIWKFDSLTFLGVNVKG